MIIVINGEVKEEREFKCQPFSYENISQEALDIHGMTVEQIRTFPQPKEIYLEIVKIFSTYVDKFDKNDKFFCHI